MSANRVTYEANGNRYIANISITIYEYKRNENDRQYKCVLPKPPNFLKQCLISTKRIKILTLQNSAGTNRANISTDITLNADNFARYTLAKYVQKQIGAYLWLPIAEGGAIGAVHPRISQMVITNGTDWDLNGGNFELNLKTTNDNLTFFFSEDSNADLASLTTGENTTPSLNDLGWTADDQYPADYIKQVK
ncbi:hypothetical protein B0O99DRAFT_692517 [Bisporella sp. PMI_857]|nr:hypothetical protein B0O99DRAFT_692517 [Bisporella sp. PMI_857]